LNNEVDFSLKRIFVIDKLNEKIKEICEKLNIHHKDDTSKYNVFNEIYKDATEKPYHFLHYDRDKSEHFHNFNELYEV